MTAQRVLVRLSHEEQGPVSGVGTVKLGTKLKARADREPENVLEPDSALGSAHISMRRQEQVLGWQKPKSEEGR